MANKAGAANKSIQLIYGGDEYLVTAKAKALVEQLCPPEVQAFGLEVVDGRVETAAEGATALKSAVEAMCTIGFMGAGKTVWLRDAVLFGDSKVSKTIDVKAGVEKLVKEIKLGLPEGNVLIISTPKVDKRSALFKVCKAAGDVHEYAAPEKDYLMERHAQDVSRKLLSKSGLKMNEDALTSFIDRTGTETRQIVQEVEKLAMYVGQQGEVTRADVEAVVSPSREAVMWSLADTVAKRNLGGALRVLRQLIYQKESAIGLIMALERRFRLLTRLRASMDRGWLNIGGRQAQWSSGSEVDEFFGDLGRDDPRKMHPYRTKLLCEQARLHSLRRLTKINQRLLRTHELLVSSPVPQHILMEILIVEITGRRPAKAR